EENVLAGGFCSAVMEAANEEGLDLRYLQRKGIPDAFIQHGTRAEQLAEVGLDKAGLASAFEQFYGRVASLR
ncbi:MAG: 1-deoxy-D-xylulose-5-phosphate synthase, partial [Oscillospiraceae bacterium]|nr:1-deoxy-D-xylulose-5-phosphate synthase [Oscillospiraceae bacterium]